MIVALNIFSPTSSHTFLELCVMPKDEDILQLVRFYCFCIFVLKQALTEFYFQIFCADFVVGNLSGLETRYLFQINLARIF